VQLAIFFLVLRCAVQGYEGQFSVYVLPTRMGKEKLEADLPPVFRQHVLPTFPVRHRQLKLVSIPASTGRRSRMG